MDTSDWKINATKWRATENVVQFIRHVHMVELLNFTIFKPLEWIQIYCLK